MHLRVKSAVILLALTVLTATSVQAANSYLFGRSADEGLGPASRSTSKRYSQQTWDIIGEGYRVLNDDYGSTQPTELRIFIKNDAYASDLTQAFVDTLSREKPNLMRLYNLSNQDYNRLAVIAFGILGKETKFGTSTWYHFKEANQQPITVPIPMSVIGLNVIAVPLKIPSLINLRKLQKKKTRDLGKALSDRDAGEFLDLDTWVTPPNSRGLTQIKSIPKTISRFYCVNAEQLESPKVAAVATLGFLAESLKITKARVRNRNLSYVTSENIYDYVLYVYFGSIRQLAEPRIEMRRIQVNSNLESKKSSFEQISDYVKWAFYGGPALNYVPKYQIERVQVNETATPDQNVYIRYVKHYIGALALFEDEGRSFRSPRNNACRVPLR